MMNQNNIQDHFVIDEIFLQIFIRAKVGDVS